MWWKYRQVGKYFLYWKNSVSRVEERALPEGATLYHIALRLLSIWSVPFHLSGGSLRRRKPRYVRKTTELLVNRRRCWFYSHLFMFWSLFLLFSSLLWQLVLLRPASCWTRHVSSIKLCRFCIMDWFSILIVLFVVLAWMQFWIGVSFHWFGFE